MNVTAIGHYLDIMIFVGIYCLINMGLSLLMGYAGQISLGHAAFFRSGSLYFGNTLYKVLHVALAGNGCGRWNYRAGGLHCGSAVPEIERTLFGHGNPGFWGYRPNLFQ